MISGYYGKKPKIHETCFIDKSAHVIGDVIINEKSSVWMNAVVRGDREKIRIGKCTNIQDNCVVHCSKGDPVNIGDYVTVGHGAVIHSCYVGNNSLIGMGSVILNGVKIGKKCMVGAGAIVTKDVPPKSLALGVPAKVVRKLSAEEIKKLKEDALIYVRLAASYMK